MNPRSGRPCDRFAAAQRGRANIADLVARAMKFPKQAVFSDEDAMCKKVLLPPACTCLTAG